MISTNVNILPVYLYWQLILRQYPAISTAGSTNIHICTRKFFNIPGIEALTAMPGTPEVALGILSHLSAVLSSSWPTGKSCFRNGPCVGRWYYGQMVKKTDFEFENVSSSLAESGSFLFLNDTRFASGTSLGEWRRTHDYYHYRTQ